MGNTAANRSLGSDGNFGSEVDGKAEAASPTAPSTSLSRRGVRASFLLKFIEEHGGRAAFDKRTTFDVCEELVNPRCVGGGSYLDVVATVGSGQTDDDVPLANLFVCHAWSYRFLYLVDAIMNYLQSHNYSPDATILWIDLFCSDHSLKARLDRQLHFLHFLKGHQALIMATKSVLVVVDDSFWASDKTPLIFTRSYCTLELYFAAIASPSVGVELAMSPLVAQRFDKALLADPEKTIEPLMLLRQRQGNDVAAEISGAKGAASKRILSENNLKATSPIDAALIASVVRTNITYKRLSFILSRVLIDVILHRCQFLCDSFAGDKVVQKAECELAIGRICMFLDDGAAAATRSTSAACLDKKCIMCLISAHDILERELGRNDERTIRATLAHATYCRRNKDYEKALEYFTYVHASRIALYGPTHELTLKVLNNMAGCQLQFADLQGAEGNLKTCMELQRQHLEGGGSPHPDTVNTINNLAVLYCNQRRWDDALPLLEELVECKEKHHGQMHIEWADAVNNLAVCLDMQSRNKEAVEKYEIALETQIALNDNPPYGAVPLQTMFNLAMCYDKINNLKMALRHIDRCYSNRIILLGHEHKDTLLAMSEFASILYRLRDMKRSLITYEECAELQRKVLGSDHPDTLSTLNNLAILYSTIHLYHKALPLCQEVYLSQVRVLGLYHRETMGAMSNLASALYKSGDYRTACPMFEQCLRQRQLILGEDHPDTCSAINNLAMVYIAMGDDETAYGLLEAVLQARKRILGNLHQDTQASAANLIEMYRKIGAYDKVVAVKEFLEQPLISTPVFLTDTGAAGGGSSSTMTSHRRASIKVSMGNVSNNINSEDSLSGHTSESTPLTSPIRTPFSAANRGSATIFSTSN